MQFHRTRSFSIFFGDSQHPYVPDLNKGFSVLARPPFNALSRTMNLRQLIFLRQVHGNAGKIITAKDTESILPSFVHEGDYLITNVSRVGIGISTADCLPIIFYDAKHNAIGIAHAGWKGSVANIGLHIIERMKQAYGTTIHDLQIFFGPSAQACCYEVKVDFLNNIQHFPYAEQLLRRTDNGLFFHLDTLNSLQLESLGIQKEAINRQYHVCTICNPSYCSVRRLQDSSLRQMTVVALN